MKESEKILFDLLKEVREDQKKDSKKIAKTETCVDKMKDDLEEVKVETAANTRHMGKHMYRTDLLEKLYTDSIKRIELLEEDSKKKDSEIQDLKTEKAVNIKSKAWVKDNIKWLLTTATLVVGIVSKVMGLW